MDTVSAIRLFIIGVFLLIFSGCSAFVNINDDNFWGRDKFYHFAASSVISASSTAIADNNGASKSNAYAIGVSSTVGIGIGKEFYDSNIKDSYWSWKDLFWDVMGSFAGGYAVFRLK